MGKAAQVPTTDNAKKERKTRVRAAGEGTIYENVKRNRWEGQFPYTDPATGKTRRKLIIGKSQTEVSRKGKEFQDNIKSGLVPGADKKTLWEWLNHWLEECIKPNVRIKTYEKYESSLKSYIKPKLGDKPIKKLTPEDFRKVFNEMLTKGGRAGVGVSTSTVRTTRRYLAMAYKQAIEDGIVTRNIIHATKPPQLVKEEIKPLSEEQANMLLKAAKEGEFFYLGVKQRRKPSPASEYHKAMAYAVVMLALNTGMRLGEVFGLKWGDIDLPKKVVNVRRSLVSSATKGMIFEEPKTKGSKRRIPVTDAVKKALERYQKEQQWFINGMGDQYDAKENLVFANLFGKPVDTSNFTTRYFKKMLVQAGLDREFCFHDLRHTHATLLLKQGVNIKVISERLGHSTIQMTLDTYSHLMPDMQQTAVDALAALNMN
jgi:integrase